MADHPFIAEYDTIQARLKAAEKNPAQKETLSRQFGERLLHLESHPAVKAALDARKSEPPKVDPPPKA